MKHAKDYLLGALANAEIHVHQEPDDSRPSYFLKWAKNLFLSAVLVSSIAQSSDITPTTLPPTLKSSRMDVAYLVKNMESFVKRENPDAKLTMTVNSGSTSTRCRSEPGILEKLLPKYLIQDYQKDRILINLEDKFLEQENDRLWLRIDYSESSYKTKMPFSFTVWHEMMHGLEMCYNHNASTPESVDKAVSTQVAKAMANKPGVPIWFANGKALFSNSDQADKKILESYQIMYGEALSDVYAALQSLKYFSRDKALADIELIKANRLLGQVFVRDDEHYTSQILDALLKMDLDGLDLKNKNSIEIARIARQHVKSHLPSLEKFAEEVYYGSVARMAIASASGNSWQQAHLQKALNKMDSETKEKCLEKVKQALNVTDLVDSELATIIKETNLTETILAYFDAPTMEEETEEDLGWSGEVPEEVEEAYRQALEQEQEQLRQEEDLEWMAPR